MKKSDIPLGAPFTIYLTEKEYDELMKRFGKYPDPEMGGVPAAIKRMIAAISNFKNIYEIPRDHYSTELYRDSNTVVTLDWRGDMRVFKYDKDGDIIAGGILLSISPERLSEGLPRKEKKEEI